MEVTLLTTSFPAHAGDIKAPFILELAKAIHKSGVNVNVVAPKFSSGLGYEEMNGVKVYRFGYFRLPFFPNLLKATSFAKSFSSFAGIIQMPLFLFSFILRAREPIMRSDLVHCQWIFPSIVAYFYSFFKPFMITSRGEELGIIQRSKFKTFIIKLILKRCSYMTANNQHQSTELKSFFHDSNKVSFTPNGIDIIKFKKNDSKKSKSLTKLPDNKFVVLFIGWLIKRKGIDYLMPAINKIVKKNKKFFFVIIGDGEMKDFVTKYLERNNLLNNVKLLDKVEPNKMPYFINSSEVFILPSLAEGRPSVILEAMACGVPVIATNIGGNNELIKDGENGILISPKSVKSISNGLMSLYNNKTLYNKIKRNSRKAIIDAKVSWESCAINFIRIYKEVKR